MHIASLVLRTRSIGPYRFLVLRRCSLRFKDAEIFIREASLADIPQIHAILTQLGLSTDDILVQGTRYWLVEAA